MLLVIFRSLARKSKKQCISRFNNRRRTSIYSLPVHQLTEFRFPVLAQQEPKFRFTADLARNLNRIKNRNSSLNPKNINFKIPVPIIVEQEPDQFFENLSMVILKPEWGIIYPVLEIKTGFENLKIKYQVPVLKTPIWCSLLSWSLRH